MFFLLHGTNSCSFVVTTKVRDGASCGRRVTAFGSALESTLRFPLALAHWLWQCGWLVSAAASASATLPTQVLQGSPCSSHKRPTRAAPFWLRPRQLWLWHGDLLRVRHISGRMQISRGQAPRPATSWPRGQLDPSENFVASSDRS